MSEVFEKYIPKFEYELVSLRDYSFEDLARFGDALSLFMMVDKLRTAEAFAEMGKLRENYGEQLNSLDVPPHLKELLVRVVTLLLRKINVPQKEVEKFVEKIDERGMSEMLAIENYNVQEVRRLAKEEARQEMLAIENYNVQEVRRLAREEERLMRLEAERKRQEAERQAGTMVQLLLKQGFSAKSIAESLATTEQSIIELIAISPQANK